MRRTLLPIALIALLCGGVAGGVAGAVASGGDDDSSASASAAVPQSAAATQDTLTPAALYKRDAPGVVVITATSTKKVAPTLFSPPETEKVQSLGSGFVIDTKGDIVTNDHVVAGASGVRVGFSGSTTYPAKVVGADPSSDLAVIRISAPSSLLHPLSFADSGSVQPGDPVYAIGNPFGLDRTMTAGIVSAVGRDIQAPNGLTIPNSIQTDAPINHGNSGGPLLDADGQVVGVNSQIEGGTVDANVGVGFAIPSDTTRTVAQQLITNGKVEHAWIGVQVVDSQQHGVVVAKVVAGSPAAKADLKGDQIVALNGLEIHTAAQLADAVARHKPGDAVELTVVRNGRTEDVGVTLASSPQSVS